MAKKKAHLTTNITLLKLKGTPFKTGTELKANKERILKEEWESIERARVRHGLLLHESNRNIIAPFFDGFSAKFVGPEGQNENLVRVYFNDNRAVQVDIDNKLRIKNTAETVESLVKSLVDGFVGGYITLLGLKNDNLFTPVKKP